MIEHRAPVWEMPAGNGGFYPGAGQVRHTGFWGASSGRGQCSALLPLPPFLVSALVGALLVLLATVVEVAAGRTGAGSDHRPQAGIAGHGADQRASGSAAEGAGPGALWD